MSKLFDDLFNDFFGRRKNIKKEDKEKPEPENNSIYSSSSNDINRLIDMLSSNETIDEKLGEPTNVEYYEEDGMFFERKTWKNVYGGEIIKTAISDQPFNETSKIKTKSLQELLLDAVNNEDYEEAARLRDEINKEKEPENQ
jgi:excinuclease UvrABC helicase subunit UvrB